MIVNSFFDWFIKSFSIDEKRPVNDCRLFKVALFAPLILALIFAVLLTYDLVISNKFEFSVTASSLNEFISYYSFSLSLLPLSIVLSLIVIRVHNSKQIISQSTLRNYYDHCEMFDNFCKSLEESHEVKIEQRILYKHFFSNCSQNNYNTKVNLELAKFYIKIISEKSKLIADLSDSEVDTTGTTLNSIKKDYLRAFRYYGINLKPESQICLVKLFEVYKYFICELYQFEGVDISLDELKSLLALISIAESLSQKRISDTYPKGLVKPDDFGIPGFVDGSLLN